MSELTQLLPQPSPEPRVEPLLLRPAEAARLLGISRSRCYQMLQRGELPALRLGGSVRVPLADLRQMIATQTGTGGAA